MNGDPWGSWFALTSAALACVAWCVVAHLRRMQ